MIQLKKDKRFEQPFSQRCRIAKNKWKEQASRISHRGNAEPSHGILPHNLQNEHDQKDAQTSLCEDVETPRTSVGI